MTEDLVTYLNSIDIPHKTRGGEIVLQWCPYCEQGQKGDYSHFYFNIDNGTFYCHHCGEKGNLYKFKLDRGDIQPVTKAGRKQKEYRRPQENPDFTKNTDKFYAWYHKKRGIEPEILKRYKVGYRKRNGKLEIIYQFYDPNGRLFNRKYRTLSKEFTTEKDAAKDFYGLQFVDFGKRELYVTEGEDDCHAMVQFGFENVVSTPYGAKNYSPEMDRVVQKFNVVYLVFDSDPEGQDGARKFAEKAGLTKCRNVVLPFKDARECLLNGLDLFDIRKAVTNAKEFRMEEMVKAGDVRDEYINYVRNVRSYTGERTRMRAFDRVVGGIRMGELTVVTGHTSRGKSTFALNFTSWAEKANMGVMVLSFESRLEAVIDKLVTIYSEKTVREWHDEPEYAWVMLQTMEWLNERVDELDRKEVYFLNQTRSSSGYYEVDDLVNIIRYARKFHNVRVFIVDHLHYFLRIKKPEQSVHQIDETVRRLKQLTLELEIHILLVVHPAKTQDARGAVIPLGLNAVKGASSIAQECDNYLVVERELDKDYDSQPQAYYTVARESKSRIRVEKNRALGRLGQMRFGVRANGNTYFHIND